MAVDPEELSQVLKTAVERWDALEWPRPRVAVVSGSGLSVDLGERVRGPIDLEYFLPFPVHAVEGHPLQVEIVAPLPDRVAVSLRGRLHGYQGYEPHETVLPVRLAARLGARVLIQTNAAGGLRADLHPGEILLVRDHLNLTGLNPLRGQLPADWGPRFPDMSAAYDPALAALAHRAAAAQGLPLGDGVYAGLAGPSYETPAEVRMLRTLGADLAGMSTVLEVIAARQMGLSCLCLSVVSNLAAGVSEAASRAEASPLSHAEVLEAGRNAAARLQRLLLAILGDPGLID